MMTKISWGKLKNQRLKKVRGATFEEVLEGVLIAEKQHLGRENQRIMLIFFKGHIWVIPFVTDEDGNMFLKTMFPSSKFTKMYKDGSL
jgi:hypothetical protein